MVFKKTFSIVVPLLWVIFWAFPCLADWETVQVLDFGVIKNTPGSTGTVKLSPDGTITGSGGYQSIENYHVGILRYNNTTGSSIRVRRRAAPSTVTLPCVSNCSSNSCTMTLRTFTFTPSNTGWITVNTNASQDFLVGATATVTANCTGVYEGVAALTVGTNPGSANDTYNFGVKMIVGDIPTTTVTPQDDLDFGDILSTTASTVTIGTNGNRTCSPTSVCVGNQSQRRSFLVENSSSTPSTITVDCPTNNVQMGGSNNFYINSFVCSLSSNTVSSGSPATVNVGATLHVPQGQASGQYSATYTVTVNN